jgi:hypothetical protein
VKQSTTNDLSRYKLSKEELEERRRARQHKPLEEYGAPIVVRATTRRPYTVRFVDA